MTATSTLFWLGIALLVLQWAGGLCLELLNARHALARRERVPEGFPWVIDEATYRKSIDYTLAKSRFSQLEDSFSLLLVLAILSTGLMPWSFQAWTAHWGASPASHALWLIAVGFAMGIPSLPFDWWQQFRLESRFGFNTTTPATWLSDRLKGWILGLALGFPLLWAMFGIVRRVGPQWWLWAWALIMVFQVVLLIVAPIWIMPLFNKFTPLPDGSLRSRLLALGTKTGFSARTIQVMDGSKRSRHSNAFFTGFGRFRKIVLFDTLIHQLSEPELEAVLAHEIGHFKLRHIPKRLAVALVTSFAAFALMGWLAADARLAAAFGFPDNSGIAPTMLMFSFLGGAFSFWLAPIGNAWSRRHEYQADAYARHVLDSAADLVGALRKLSEKNLSNLTPHPLYSAFHYSHPTLLEREKALHNIAA